MPLIDFSGLLGPAVVAALVSGFISLVSMFVNRATTIRISKERFDFDKELAVKKRSDELQLAARKFQYERDLHDHKRRVELAEQVLADFYHFADIIREIRSPRSFKDESADRDRFENETPTMASKLDAYYVPIARILKQSDSFSGLRAKRYQSRALLGQPIGEAFDALNEALSEVKSKATMLIDAVLRGGQPFEIHRDLMEQYEATIWKPLSDDDDPVEPIVKRAIEIAESVCRPILSREI